MVCPQSMLIRSETDGQGYDAKRSDKNRHIDGLTAMVVDDNPTTLKLIAAMLVRIGYDVHTVREGIEALYDFHDSPFDLVLTDYEMPIIDGYQMGRKIKFQRPATRVVIMTGLGRSAVGGLMADNTIDGWLFKPFDLEKLKALLSGVGLSPESSGKT